MASLVWTRVSNVYWEEHLYHGDGEIDTTDYPPLRG
jgi:hypothetical protein